MNKLELDVEKLKVDSFSTLKRLPETEAAEGTAWAWSDESVCPTTAPSDRRPCY